MNKVLKALINIFRSPSPEEQFARGVQMVKDKVAKDGINHPTTIALWHTYGVGDLWPAHDEGEWAYDKGMIHQLTEMGVPHPPEEIIRPFDFIGCLARFIKA